MSTHDEQITVQAEQLGRMLAKSGSFANVAKAIARGFAESSGARVNDPQYRAFIELMGADSLVRGAELARGWLVDDARDAGLSWTKIGTAMEVTKQAAFQRYGRAA